ncbi:PKD domain-containing protein [Bacteroidota bacterium]
MNHLKSLCLLIAAIFTFLSSSGQYSISPDIALYESNLNGRVLTINVSPDSLKLGITISDFQLMNEPPGLSIANVVWTGYGSADITLNYIHSDFDTDISNFMVDIQLSAMQWGAGGLTYPLPITALIESSAISPDSILTEQRLDWREIEVNLTNETFEEYALLTPADFTLINAPVGLTIFGVTGMLPTQAIIDLAFDGTDFDVDITDFAIDIQDAALTITSAGPLTSNILTIQAYDEPAPIPVIQNITIPNVPMKIGDVVTATITVDDDLGAAFTLITGNIGGNTLYGLAKTNNTTYTCQFDILDGGTDFLTIEDIPIDNLVLDNAGMQNAPYANTISQANDPIDANRPIIVSVTATGGDRTIYSGDSLILSISAIEDGLILDNSSTINGVPASTPNVYLSDLGGGTYIITYRVQFGDTDVLPGNLAISLIMTDPAGNNSIAETGLNANSIEINANTILATMVADSVLEEKRLDVRALHIGLRNDYFLDTNTLDISHFNIIGGTAGLTLEQLVIYTPDSIRIELAFDHTDFDLDTFLIIGIDYTQLANSVTNLETPPLPIYAVAESGPEIYGVLIPNTPAGIGDTIPVTIYTMYEPGKTYTLASGTIGDYPVFNLSKLTDSTYAAILLIYEGGNNYAAIADIPVDNLQFMDGTTPGNIYNTPISQNGDLIDAKRPVITQATVMNPELLLVSGDTVEILVQADSSGYELSTPASTVNGQGVVTYQDNGDSSYTVFYPILFGDPDAASSTLVISLVMKDAAENTSAAFTTLDANTLEIIAENAILTIQEDSVLIEHTLDDRIIALKLVNETFIDHTLLTTGDFGLINAPAGLSIESIKDTAPDSASLLLAFDGTDFSTPIADFQVFISNTVLKNSTLNLNSSNLLLINNSAVQTLQLTYTKTDISKAGAADGSINLDVSGGVPPYTFAWSNGAFMEDLTMLSAGSYTVTVTDTEGTEVSESIEILDANACTFTVNFSHSVAGSTVTFTNLSDADNYNWQFGDGSVSEVVSPTHTYTFPGLYEICLLGINSSGDCVSEKCVKIEVGTIDCSAEFGFIRDSVSANKISFVNTTKGAADAWYWNFGDGETSTKKDPVHTFPEPGHYMVCLNTIDKATGCQSEFCLEITVGTVEVKADFTYFVDPATRKVTFTDHSSGDITSWYWTFGDGTIDLGKDTIHQYDRADKYPVCLIVWDEKADARDEICHEIQVGTPVCNVRADFSYFVDAATRNVKMTDLSTGNAKLWFWDFGDGTTSSSRNPAHVYADSGVFLVSVSVRDNIGDCFDIHSEWIQVGGIDCYADFTHRIDPETKTVYFKDRSRGDIAEYFWYLDDGAYSSSSEFSHTYEEAGRYDVSLTVVDKSGKCMDFQKKEIQVGSIECKADFTHFIDSASNEVFFLSNIIGNATNLLWTFGDGFMTKEENPVYKFPAPGYYSVGLNTFDSINGCMDYNEKIILIGSQGQDCKSDFIYQTDLTSKEVKFTSKSLGEIVEYIWNFGDENTSSEKNPTHVYTETGNIWVCLTVINSAGYSDISCKQIQVAPTAAENCLASFIYTVDSVNSKVTFRDKSFGEPDSWAWDFDDESGSDLEDPVHTYTEAGFYTVILEISNSTTGCSHKAVKLINVSQGNQGLRSDFIYDKTGDDKKADTYPVDFIGVSLGDGAKLKWDFGDGESDSTTLNPKHFYRITKPWEEFECCLTVSNPITKDSHHECQTITIGNVNTPVIFGEGLVLANHPNPFDEQTRITYRLPTSTNVDLSVYDFAGRKIRELINASMDKGTHSLELNRDGFANGIYILKLSTTEGYRTSKMIIR